MKENIIRQKNIKIIKNKLTKQGRKNKRKNKKIKQKE